MLRERATSVRDYVTLIMHVIFSRPIALIMRLFLTSVTIYGTSKHVVFFAYNIINETRLEAKIQRK